MRTIQMYTSSRDLRRGLTRALSLLALDPHGDEQAPWWARLPEPVQPRARAGALDLEQLASLLLDPEIIEAMNRVRVRLGVAPVDAVAQRSATRRALISGRAHAAHLGRDIYGESNKALWDLAVAPLGEAVAARWGTVAADAVCHDLHSRETPPGVRARLDRLVGFHTGPRDGDHEACANWLYEQLEVLGFTVAQHRRTGAPPVLEARRPARGLAGHVVLYGHYDTVGANARRWSSDPDRVCERDGRLFARGIADNKGPLAARLWALTTIERAPALTWLIQGEEETGSVWSREVLGRLVPDIAADLWIDETGYHDHDTGALRLLARVIGAGADVSLAPDAVLAELLDGLRILAASAGVATRAEQRGLNKSVVAGGCPFNHSLPPGARYLALGVNDSHARIHAHDESLPPWAFELHRDQLALVFDSVGRAREAAA